jgi:hypothetical protein
MCCSKGGDPFNAGKKTDYIKKMPRKMNKTGGRSRLVFFQGVSGSFVTRGTQVMAPKPGHCKYTTWFGKM